MRDKKVKRKNKQKEDAYINKVKVLDEYYARSLKLNLTNREYNNGIMSFFKDKKDFLDFCWFDDVTGLVHNCFIIGILNDYLLEVLADIYFSDLKCTEWMYEYLMDYESEHFMYMHSKIEEVSEDTKVRYKLGLNLIVANNPTYTLPNNFKY